MVTEYVYWRKMLCGCFPFIWLWLLSAIIKRCAERCALQLYRTSLKSLFWNDFFFFFDNFVFMAIYLFIQAFLLNLIPSCTSHNTSLWFNACCKIHFFSLYKLPNKFFYIFLHASSRFLLLLFFSFFELSFSLQCC